MKDTLTHDDWKSWRNDTLIYCILPTVLVFLSSLQSGDLKTALGATQVALIASLINLLRKHAAGTDSVVNQGTQTTQVAQPTIK